MTLLERAKIAKKDQRTWQIDKDIQTLETKLWSVLSLRSGEPYKIILYKDTPFVKIEDFWFRVLDKDLYVITKEGIELKIEYLGDLTKINNMAWSFETQELYKKLEKLNG